MKHGNGGYTRGCRCQECKAGRKAYAVGRRQRTALLERERRARDPQPKRDAERRYRQQHPEKARAKAKRRYHRTYPVRPEMWLAAVHRRRARVRQAPGTATAAQIEARIAYYGWRCWMCGVPWQVRDHVIPLSCGGSNWPANLRPACESCNGRKHARRVA